MAATTRIPGIDADILPLNLGGNTFGWTSDEQRSFEVLDAFVAAGGSFIDTADVYSAWAEGHSGGESETVLGRWLAARGNREDVIIATKTGRHPDFQGLARETVTASLEASLERLQTDRIDLYYAHYDDESVAISDQVRTFHELVQSGKVLTVGLSNYSPARMREFFEIARREGLTAPVAIQPQYSLVHRRDYEQDYSPIAREYGAAVFPYFTLASGFLTGKYRTREDLEGAARKDMAEGYFSEDGLRVVDAVVEVAKAHDAEPATVALAWLLARGISAPIASASKPEQLPSLIAATRLELAEDEVTALNEASQPFA
ncbi:aldo/keto reductase [Kocuria palustris]|uniref:aldo/keto reductase n=1 Tax=Kocuria palustris TaxID=71999 RepID=UPI0011A382D3|nr:aldo/keto reductase [Kocuria palustris]